MPKPRRRESPQRRTSTPRRSKARRDETTHAANSARANADVSKLRELFWNNVIREILTSLSAMSTGGGRRARKRAEPSSVPGPGGPSKELAAPEPDAHDPFDGRLAVIVGNGTRIPIAAVFPLFACGVPGSAAERSLSVAVECTVFQIHTPSGEVYTLPLHEIRGFHALTDELMAELIKAGQEDSEDEDGAEKPFGFAAFTSLARGMPPTAPGASAGGAWGVEPAL